MPELPEVEAARRAIEEHCLGKKIKRAVVADDPKVIDGGISPSDFQASLIGKTIVAARRKGKNMWLVLDSRPFPSFQFGMTGAIYIKGVAVTKYRRSMVNDTDDWPSKFSKVFIELDDGLEFSFTDKRRLAKVRLLEDPKSVAPISDLGPDALTEPMEVDEFVKSLSERKIGIKALLLDQSYIAGIGNWIADEVLYQAKIHPLQVVASLSKQQAETLHKCINEVIEKALEVGADSSQFPSNWIFHFREKKPGKAFVDGKKIEFITAGGRTSAIVPELQKLTGTQSGKEQSKRTKQSNRSIDVKEESDSRNGVDVEKEADGGDGVDDELTKKRQNTKRPSKKRPKNSQSDADDGQVEKTVKTTKSKQTKVPVTSKKRIETYHDGSETDEELEKTAKMKKNKVAMETESTKKVKSSLHVQQKKKARK